MTGDTPQVDGVKKKSAGLSTTRLQNFVHRHDEAGWQTKLVGKVLVSDPGVTKPQFSDDLPKAACKIRPAASAEVAGR